MIQINLLPIKEAKRRKQMFLVLYAGAVALFVLVVLGWFWWTQFQKVDDLKRRIQKVEEESKGYESQIKEVKDLQAKEAALETYRSAIVSIYDDQKKILSALDEIGVMSPSDIILESITEGRDKDDMSLVIKGSSMTEASIQSFVERLKRPGGPLKNPSVVSISFRADKSLGTNYLFEIKVEIGGVS
jgi:Tfp pilus assembly protein PilN